MSNGWRKNHGRCPVDGEVLVRVRIRMRDRADAARQPHSPARNWRWSLTDLPGDILEYQVAT